VAKVKKTAAVTGVRNVKASKKAAPKKATKKAAGKSSRGKSDVRKSSGKTKAKSMSRVGTPSNARAKTGKARLQTSAPVVRVSVKPLEPQAKCGAGTSVQHLFKVDRTVDGKTTAHLVFFDRHGWYCEHGRHCPAVEHAKKYQGHIARAS
jgi:hypothetical protein